MHLLGQGSRWRCLNLAGHSKCCLGTPRTPEPLPPHSMHRAGPWSPDPPCTLGSSPGAPRRDEQPWQCAGNPSHAQGQEGGTHHPPCVPPPSCSPPSEPPQLGQALHK